MVPDLNDIKVKRILKKINSKYEPIYIPVVSESYALLNECFPNVEKKVKLDGGSIVFGWQIWKTPLICEAEFHGIWKSHDGNLLDITPKNPHVESILFIQDDNVLYNGAQIDNIRINNTDNPLVNDIIDIHKALFRIRNKGDRAFVYKSTLKGEEARVYRNLESFGSILQNYIYQGGQINAHCFCGSGYLYTDCHRRELDSLILRSKSF
ncbi:hypothetical protein [Paenibacillus terreus]|uniref:hypothetical protein n=1 Tax=Paenibacillus terreus TaxID=1387834 RepID=UPI0035CD1EB5